MRQFLKGLVIAGLLGIVIAMPTSWALAGGILKIARQQDIIKELLVRHTGQPMDKITHDTDRDFYLNPPQAVEYGIIDEVLDRPTGEKEDEKKGKK